MSDSHRPTIRVLVAAVANTKHAAGENAAKAVIEVVERAGVVLVRSVVVKGERQYIRQLVSNVANDNEADAVLLLGGSGIGPHDDACEAVDGFADRRIEGFGEAYRRLLEADLGPRAMLARATAGVYNQCLVFVVGGRAADVVRAVESLVVPVLGDAVDLATGRHGLAHIR